MLPFLSVQDNFAVNTAVASREQRPHLIKAYFGLSIPSFDKYVFTDSHGFRILRWVIAKGINLQDFTLELHSERLRWKGQPVHQSGPLLASLMAHNENKCTKGHYSDIIEFYASRGKLDGLDVGIKGEITGTSVRAGSNALGIACMYGYITVVKKLLSAGVDENLRNDGGWTPLMLAAKWGVVETVKCMIASGAEVNPSTPSCYSIDDGSCHVPLSLAANNGHVEVLRILLQAGADKEMVDSSSLTPLLHAAITGHDGILNILIEAGAIVDKADKRGKTPLMWAAQFGYSSTVSALIAAGANKFLADNAGLTAMTYAAPNSNAEIMKMVSGR